MSFWHNFPNNRVLADLSLWSADMANFEGEFKRMDPYADLYHIDAADGHFSAQFLFFPDLVARLRQLTQKPFHVHLMVDNSILLSQIDQFMASGANLITIWFENGELVPVALERIRRSGVAAGMSIQLDTEPEAVIPYLDHIELVTMIGTPAGVKGQDLDERACQRMQRMRQIMRERGLEEKVKLAADGGNRLHTVPNLRAAGADLIVLGSLAYQSKNLNETFNWLWSLNGPQWEK